MAGWIVPSEVTDAPVRLFCFPYAGGGASVYRDWIRAAEGRLYAMQPPGRENRLGDPLLYSLEESAQKAAEAILPYTRHPYALFGHSLGARVAFEVTRKLRSRGAAMPVHLFVSGSLAPEQREARPLHQLNDTDFVKELQRFGNTRAEIFEHPEILGFFLPMLRADFTVDETYEYRVEPLLSVPITAFCGTEDAEATPQQMEEWGRYTTGAFSLQCLSGGHFFFQDPHNAMPRRLMAILSQTQAA